jgi:hypothetical protein
VELSPWAVTVLAPGGVEIIPQPPKKPYPSDPSKASAADYAPDRLIVYWPYFSFLNQGWNFGARYITLWPSLTRQGAKYGPTKVGMSHRLGWVAYLNEGDLFVKRFDFEKDKTYPDGGCNLETFANPDMLDIEQPVIVQTVHRQFATSIALGIGKDRQHSKTLGWMVPVACPPMLHPDCSTISGPPLARDRKRVSLLDSTKWIQPCTRQRERST